MKKSVVFSVVLSSAIIVFIFSWLIGGGQTAVHAATFIVNSTTDAVDANPGDGVCATSGNVCTLRAAIQETNAFPGNDTITLPAGTYHLSITGTGEDNAATGDLDITDHLTINGNNAISTRIDGNTIDRVFQIFANTTLSKITIQNGEGYDPQIFECGGGGIRQNSGNLIINNSQIINNSTTQNGGGICNFTFGDITLNNTLVDGNTANNRGGAIHMDLPNNITLVDSTISNNSAYNGGGISYLIGNGAKTFNIESSHILTNTAEGSGGAIYYEANSTTDVSHLNIKDSVFAGNLIPSYGDYHGAGIVIYGSNSIVSINDTTFRDNSNDKGAGGAISNSGNKITMGITRTNFLRNTANSWGGAIYFKGLTNTLAIEDSTFSSNLSNSNGGAVALYGKGSSFETVGVHATINNSSFNGNSANFGGGGLYHSIGTDVSISHSAFINNIANDGGGMYSGSDGMSGGAYAYVTNSTFSGNSAREYGGGLYAHTLSTDGSLRNVTIAYNTADSDNNGSGDGGGIAIYNNASFSFSNSLIANNIDMGNEAPDCFAAHIFSWANNLIGKTDGCTFTPDANDLLGTIASPLDPKLQPLTGSPAYHPLEIDSPAIDTGLDAPPIDDPGYINCMTTDQDGSIRPVDGDGDGNSICDIGAIEAPTRILHAVEPVLASTLVYTNTQNNPTIIDIPAGAVTETTNLLFIPQTAVTPPADMSFANHAFTLNAYRHDELLPSFVFEQPITVTIHYSDDDIVGADEETLTLLYWNGTMWSDDGISIIERDLVNNKLVASVQHLSEFAMFGQSHQVYLPFISR